MYSCAIICEWSPINGFDVHPKLQNVLFPSTSVSSDWGAQRWPISCLSCGQTDGRPGRRITFCLTLLGTGSGFRLSQVIESSLACSLCHHPWRAAKNSHRNWIKYISWFCQQAVLFHKLHSVWWRGRRMCLDGQDTYLLFLRSVALGCPASGHNIV